MNVYDKLIEAMGNVRSAMGLVEAVCDHNPPASLIGVHPKLRALLDDLNIAAHDAAENEGAES